MEINQVQLDAIYMDHDYLPNVEHADAHLIDHDYILPMQNDEDVHNANDNNQFWPVGNRPDSYIKIPGVHQHELVVQDNLGFLYYKSKLGERRIYLKCKETVTNGCTATGSISRNNDNAFILRRLHNHPVRPLDNHVRDLRHVLGNQCIQQTVRSFSARQLYMEAIVSNPEGAANYSFIQAAKRMRRIRGCLFPPTPTNLVHLNDLLQLENNRHFTMSFQEPPSLFYQGPLIAEERFAGLLFCNINHIMSIEHELQTVTIAGCDGTFKTVPKTLSSDCYQLFTFQVVHRNVSFPMVYALLTGKTEDIYLALFRYIRRVLPLTYANLIIITDFEIAQINAIKTVFPESNHQGCYFHYCQSILRHMRTKEVGIYNLVKTNLIAARTFRMILALPYLPAVRNGRIPSMLDGFNAIILYIRQHPEVAYAFHAYLYNYLLGFWFDQITPERFTVYGRGIRTNNYLESYHAALLRIIKPHPKIWEFLDQLRFLENLSNVEFNQVSLDMKIRMGVPTRKMQSNTAAIENFMGHLMEDEDEDRIQNFLRRAGHRVDGYISQQFGPYPGEDELLLLEAEQID